MSTSLPFHSSLVLGNIVDPSYIAYVSQLNQQNQKMDNSEKKQRSFILQKHKLDLVREELLSLGISEEDIKPIDAEIQRVHDELIKATVAYSQSVIAGESQISDIKNNQFEKIASDKSSKANQSTIESPLDYSACQLEVRDLSFDSLDLNAQYFNFNSANNDPDRFSSEIANHVHLQTSAVLSNEQSNQIKQATKSNVSKKASEQDIQGTLVITANCTHKSAHVFSTLKLDADKALRAWNASHPSDCIDTEALLTKRSVANATSKNSLEVLTSVTYGSSFVGMVHVVEEASQSLSEQMEDIKQQLATGTKQTHGKLQAHCSVITTGLIPEIAPMKMDTTLQSALGSPEKQLEQCSSLEHSEGMDLADSEDISSDQSYIKRNQDNAKFIAQTLSELKQKTCKLLDVEAMVNLFDNYVEKAASLCGGVPINFYVTSFSKQDVCEAWLKKYRPTSKEKLASPENDDNS